MALSRSDRRGGGRARVRGGRWELLTGFAWDYAHLAIFAGLTAVAVGIELAIGEATEG